ncbi:hypothetical protein BED47_15385 [Gottfriedia luciferensis]|uniref:Uncharacterized protein n=1 Tax=Gottfriedia luciferensis TaxID=178774 RepID=A0ABX2ZJB3_9BACI|nr:hypothetical protein [Gottfriedia luciferensis]ODG89790.1 hypothetical protein BED47_15385 [Gottfriedia luciferensis]
MQTSLDEYVDWNEGVLDSYGISGKAETPQAFAEEAKESRPMESEHPVVEINITILLLRKFGKLIDKIVFQQREKKPIGLLFLDLDIIFMYKSNISLNKKNLD